MLRICWLHFFVPSFYSRLNLKSLPQIYSCVNNNSSGKEVLTLSASHSAILPLTLQYIHSWTIVAYHDRSSTKRPSRQKSPCQMQRGWYHWWSKEVGGGTIGHTAGETADTKMVYDIQGSYHVGRLWDSWWEWVGIVSNAHFVSMDFIFGCFDAFCLTTWCWMIVLSGITIEEYAYWLSSLSGTISLIYWCIIEGIKAKAICNTQKYYAEERNESLQ